MRAEEISAWWDSFGDVQLSQLVRSVLGANLDLRAAVDRIEVSRAVYGVVAADRLPTVDATGSYSRTRPLVATPTQDQWTVGGRLSWEIDLFGRIRRSVEASLASFEADVEDLRAVQVALAAETAAVYVDALSLSERLAIARRNVASQARSRGIAEDRFQAGMTANLDPAQARVNLHTTEAAVPALELLRRRALHRLAVLCGKDPRALLEVVAADQPLPDVPSEMLVGIPADLLRNRPDIRGLERRLAAQSAQVGVATASLYPSVNLSGTWDWLARTPSRLFDSGTGFGGIGPLVTVPVFNAGRLRSQVRAEEAALRQLDKQLRQQVLVAQEEVENALFAIVRDRRQAQLLDQALQAAGQAVELSQQLYTSGQSDFQNVLDAQRSAFALEDELAVGAAQHAARRRGAVPRDRRWVGGGRGRGRHLDRRVSAAPGARCRGAPRHRTRAAGGRRGPRAQLARLGGCGPELKSTRHSTTNSNTT